MCCNSAVSCARPCSRARRRVEDLRWRAIGRRKRGDTGSGRYVLARSHLHYELSNPRRVKFRGTSSRSHVGMFCFLGVVGVFRATSRLLVSAVAFYAHRVFVTFRRAAVRQRFLNRRTPDAIVVWAAVLRPSMCACSAQIGPRRRNRLGRSLRSAG